MVDIMSTRVSSCVCIAPILSMSYTSPYHTFVITTTPKGIFIAHNWTCVTPSGRVLTYRHYMSVLDVGSEVCYTCSTGTGLTKSAATLSLLL